MGDNNLVCRDCGREFVFNESEQAFYKEKGFENEPTRCPNCRKERKQQRNGGGGGRSGGGYGGGGRKSW
jgi:DNA-directed RNA polymerase subunit RPC12/RpoP